MNDNDNWVGVEEIARYLGVKPTTIREWIKKKNGIPAYKIGKQWKFKRAEVDAWIQKGKNTVT